MGINVSLCNPLTRRNSPLFEELEFQQKSYKETYTCRDKHTKEIYTWIVDILQKKHAYGVMYTRRDIYMEVTYT